MQLEGQDGKKQRADWQGGKEQGGGISANMAREKGRDGQGERAKMDWGERSKRGRAGEAGDGEGREYREYGEEKERRRWRRWRRRRKVEGEV